MTVEPPYSQQSTETSKTPPTGDGATSDGPKKSDQSSIVVETQGRKGQSKQKLTSASVLANKYVPDKFRMINEALATPLFAAHLPALDLASIGTVPFTPAPFISIPSVKLCPIRAASDDDMFYYAVEERRRKLYGDTHKTKKDLPLVDSIADIQDYCRTFEQLLITERCELALLYERYSQYKHPLRIELKKEAPNGMLTYTCTSSISGIGDANPPLQVGDIMLLRTMKALNMPVNPMVGYGGGIFPPKIIEIRSTIQSVQRKGDRIHGTWLDNMMHQTLKLASKDAKLRYNQRFVPQPTKHLRCLSALDWMAQQPPQYMMPFMFPTSAPSLPSDELFIEDNNMAGENMNLQQKDFVKLVLRRTRHPEYQAVRGPVILTGPAGTGKTNTMITAILQVLQVNSDDKLHVLICTPSHTAADNIVTRLSKHLNKEELFRLYDSTRPVETVPIQTLGYTRQSGGSGDFCLPTLKELLTFRVIICTCDDAHILYRIGVTNEQLRVRRGDFARYMDQASHACNIGVSMSGLDKFHFTHLFIDEAAQATEPESLIPLSVVVDSEPGVRKCEIVLVGDPRQLSPSVYSNEATVAGLGRSWIERLLLRPVGALGGGREHMLGQAPASVLDFVQLSFRENLSIFLTRNYRGHPSFLMMPSALFYFDKLQSAVSMNGCYDWCQKLRWIESLSDPVTPQNGIQADLIPKDLQTRKQFDWPIHLRGVQGRDCSVTIQSGFAGNSWQNVGEANTIVDIAVALSKKGVSSASIGVMAPFRAQVVLIRDLMRRKGLGGVNVGLVEDYQAVERDVILLSLTRSSQLLVEHDIQQRMGLFGQPKRCNVALTRAKSLLVVVGDPRTMLQDFVWRQFVLFCLRNGLFYGYHGDDNDAYQWNPNKKIVATRPESNNGAGISLAGQPSVQQNCVIANDPDLIFISSLERSFRDTKYK